MSLFKPTNATPLPNYRLHVRFVDGVEGEVDLSHLAGKGVFAIWNDAEVFNDVTIGEGGEIRWGKEVDLCADAIYAEITGGSVLASHNPHHNRGMTSSEREQA